MLKDTSELRLHQWDDLFTASCKPRYYIDRDVLPKKLPDHLALNCFLDLNGFLRGRVGQVAPPRHLESFHAAKPPFCLANLLHCLNTAVIAHSFCWQELAKEAIPKKNLKQFGVEGLLLHGQNRIVHTFLSPGLSPVIFSR